MRSYYVMWQGEKFLDLGGNQLVAKTVWSNYDPGPVVLAGFATPWVKKYVPIPSYSQMLNFMNFYDVIHHPADPIIITYWSVLMNYCGGVKDDREGILTPDGQGYTRHHHYTRDRFF